MAWFVSLNIKIHADLRYKHYKSNPPDIKCIQLFFVLFILCGTWRKTFVLVFKCWNKSHCSMSLSALKGLVLVHSSLSVHFFLHLQNHCGRGLVSKWSFPFEALILVCHVLNEPRGQMLHCSLQSVTIIYIYIYVFKHFSYYLLCHIKPYCLSF